MTNHISKACFKNQDSHKPSLQQKRQAIMTKLDDKPAEKKPIQGTEDSEEVITFAGLVQEKGNKESKKKKLKQRDKSETSAITIHGDTSWSLRYEKKSMTFDAKLGERRTKVLIDTGSFVTLIDDRLLESLANKKKVGTTLKWVEGIGGITKEIKGATIVKIKIGKQELPLKCHIVHNLAIPIVLGRDMMSITTIAIDLIEDIFQKEYINERSRKRGYSCMHAR